MKSLVDECLENLHNIPPNGRVNGTGCPNRRSDCEDTSKSSHSGKPVMEHHNWPGRYVGRGSDWGG